MFTGIIHHALKPPMLSFRGQDYGFILKILKGSDDTLLTTKANFWSYFKSLGYLAHS